MISARRSPSWRCCPTGVTLVSGGCVRPHRAAFRPAPQVASRSSAPRGDARFGLVTAVPLPGRPDAGSAVRKKSAVTNRDKKDSIRGRMADTGESFNVARRNVEAAAAGQVPRGEDPYQLIEVEVGTDANFPDRPAHPRHFETFWGRWIIAPDPEKTRPVGPGQSARVYYGVAQTRRGRIAVYTAED